VLATNVDSELKTLPDIIKAAQAQPGKLNVGTITVGGTQNLAAELLKSSAGLDLQIVPYRGTPDVIVALLRNDVALMVDFYAPMKPTLLDKKIRAIATSGPQRSPFLPGVPSVAEAGVPGYEVVSWNGIFARTGTPAEIKDVAQRYGVFARKTDRGDVDHTFLTSLVDRAGALRVQYMGVRFDPDEMLRDLRSLLREGGR
jgi:tripartite-type tricarboxylate transporter receptor subunit TctC